MQDNLFYGNVYKLADLLDQGNRVKNLTLGRGWAVSNPNTGAFLHRIDAWGFPKHPDRTLILPPDADLTASLETFVGANMPLLKETNCWLGIWVYPATQDICLDVTTSCKELYETLRAAARINAVSKRKIIAAHNSSRDETVYL